MNRGVDNYYYAITQKEIQITYDRCKMLLGRKCSYTFLLFFNIRHLTPRSWVLVLVERLVALQRAEIKIQNYRLTEKFTLRFGVAKELNEKLNIFSLHIKSSRDTVVKQQPKG